MNETSVDDRAVIAEALTILSKHMEPSKVVRVIAALQWDGTDYVEFRRKLFADVPLDDLVQQVRAFEKKAQG